jgi:rhamnose utilization protein RhaD (predicted bifunctional aldolase and dehydrogenase)
LSIAGFVCLFHSLHFLILLRALHTTCGQQAKKSYEKDLAAIQRADAAGAERLAATTIDTGPKVAQATAERGQVSTEAQRQPSSANEGQKVGKEILAEQW